MAWSHAYYSLILRGKFNLATVVIFKFLNCKKKKKCSREGEKNSNRSKEIKDIVRMLTAIPDHLDSSYSDGTLSLQLIPYF